METDRVLGDEIASNDVDIIECEIFYEDSDSDYDIPLADLKARITDKKSNLGENLENKTDASDSDK